MPFPRNEPNSGQDTGRSLDSRFSSSNYIKGAATSGRPWNGSQAPYPANEGDSDIDSELASLLFHDIVSLRVKIRGCSPGQFNQSSSPMTAPEYRKSKNHYPVLAISVEPGFELTASSTSPLG
ncbi:unnamed protein product [Dibothriocephalus latus]|uniref:Uncharacterized protein n=1 Tax=Dibothriocephalus latus TaxID=60516 RepID=A0A3P7N6K2_DIBLA|nr:unnamed protein product [Dibothriocephalus latus]